MPDTPPTSYADLVQLLRNLPLLVRERRRQLGVSQREACRQAGLASSTVSRCEARHDVSLGGAIRLLAWIGGIEEVPRA